MTALLFFFALRWRDERLQKLCYVSFLLCAAFSGVAYFTGPATYEFLQELEGFTSEMRARAEDHAVTGRAVFVGMVLLGLGALVSLLAHAQGQPPSKSLRWGILVAAIFMSLLLAWTSHEGGLVRRLEFS
jgi:protein-S-isoprenylcysteine O-methyltransferase Ste14